MGNKISTGKKNTVKKIIEQHEDEDDENDESGNGPPAYIPQPYDESEDEDDEEELSRAIEARYKKQEEEETKKNRQRERDAAFNEIHVSFFRIDLKEYLNFIDSHIEPIDYNSLDLARFIEDNFFTFIEENFVEPFKRDLKFKLEKVFEKMVQSVCYTGQISKWKILLGKTIQYVFTRNNEFTKTYVITFTNDTYFGYKDELSSISCSQGIIERFITIISSVIEIICLTVATCDDEDLIMLYKILNNSIDINEFTQDWATEHLDTEIVQGMNKEERKTHFIKYIKNKYKAKKKQDLSPDDIRKIEKYADQLDDAEIFARGQFGGKTKKRGSKIRKTKRRRKFKK